MTAKKRGLGRGLDALLGNLGGGPATEARAGEVVHELPLTALTAGAHQPRRHFDEAALQELAESIKAQGVVQPIVVRALGDDRFEIVAGERRCRAAQMAGLATVPALVRSLDERDAMAIALVENIQRADLNPLEEAMALAKLIQACEITHEACAVAVGKSRASVSNLLRLLDLEADVQELLRAGQLSFGHAKVLLSVHGHKQSQLARMVVQQQLSVRQTEALVFKEPSPAKPSPHTPPIETELSHRWGMPVRVQVGAQGQGKLTISFKTNQELERVLAALR